MDRMCRYAAYKVIWWDMTKEWQEFLYRWSVDRGRLNVVLQRLDLVLGQLVSSCADSLSKPLARNMLRASVSAYKRVLLDGGAARYLVENTAAAPTLCWCWECVLVCTFCCTLWLLHTPCQVVCGGRRSDAGGGSAKALRLFRGGGRWPARSGDPAGDQGAGAGHPGHGAAHCSAGAALGRGAGCHDWIGKKDTCTTFMCCVHVSINNNVSIHDDTVHNDNLCTGTHAAAWVGPPR